MAPKLYLFDTSPPARAVLLAAKTIGVPLELVYVDVINKQEQLLPEFRKLNPQHTIPTLEDNGFIIWDSHAILGYLVAQYAKDDSLYPTDPVKRAVVDQRLHFDTGVLYPKLVDIVLPILYHGETSVSQSSVEIAREVYEFLEEFLNGKKWLAGDDLTVADISCVTDLSSMDGLVPVDRKRFPRLVRWYEQCQALPHYQETNGIRLELHMKMLKSKLK